MKLLMKWTQFINDYQKSTLREPMAKQLVLQSYFYVLPRLTNIMIDKGFNLFNECAPLLPEGTVKSRHLAA